MVEVSCAASRTADVRIELTMGVAPIAANAAQRQATAVCQADVGVFLARHPCRIGQSSGNNTAYKVEFADLKRRNRSSGNISPCGWIGADASVAEPSLNGSCVRFSQLWPLETFVSARHCF